MTAPAQFVFDDRPDDIPATELSVEGSLPVCIKGSFLFNGPGQTQIGGQQLHVFDGFGRVVSAALGEGSASLSARHVETPLLARERAANKVTRRRLFANKPGRWSNLFDLNLGNSCMHNVYSFAGRTFAGQDRGHFEIESESLAVKGAMRCGGLHGKGTNATPMPRMDPETGHLILWLQKPGPKDSITMVELDQDLNVAHQQSCKLPPGLIHDVAFTKDYYIITRFAKLAVLKVLWGASPVFDAVGFDDEVPVLYLIPRRGGEPKAVKLPARVHFHYFNAFQENGEVVVDTIGYPGRVTFRRLMPQAERERLGLPDTPTPIPEVVRYRISLDTLAVQERIMPDVACEAPEVNPEVRGRPSRYGYASAKTESDDAIDPGAYAWFGGVAKLDFTDNRATVWQAPAGCTASPPVFVPDPARSGEDAGFVLSWVQNPKEKRSSMVVLDAQALDQGPVARAHYPKLLGLISHVSFHARD